MTALLSDFTKVPRVLRLNVAGLPTDWVSWQEAVCLYARDIVVWTLGDPVLRIRGGRARFSGIQSGTEIHGIIACEGRVVPQKQLAPPLTNRALFRRDQGICLYCGKSFIDGELTRFIRLVSAGEGRSRFFHKKGMLARSLARSLISPVSLAALL